MWGSRESVLGLCCIGGPCYEPLECCVSHHCNAYFTLPSLSSALPHSTGLRAPWRQRMRCLSLFVLSQPSKMLVVLCLIRLCERKRREKICLSKIAQHKDALSSRPYGECFPLPSCVAWVLTIKRPCLPCREREPEPLPLRLPSDITVSECVCGGGSGNHQTVHNAAHRDHGHPHRRGMREPPQENVDSAHC